jgi:hypothetical protein
MKTSLRSPYASRGSIPPKHGDFTVFTDGEKIPSITLQAKDLKQAKHRARLAYPNRKVEVVQVW